MKKLTIINHYDDEKLTYSANRGRYELTKEYCKDEFGSPFKDDAELERRICLNSRVVYDYINLHVAQVNKPVVAFLLNRTQEGRDYLLALLTAQMYADVQTGYNDLLYQPAVNFTGQDKDRAAIRQNALCVAAEQIFEDSDSYFGIRISYQAQFPYPYFIFVRQYN